jgi:hypothetical protein
MYGVGPRGNVNSGPVNGQSQGNDVGLCSICFGPLYVSIHDPKGKALRRRIERRYLGQLMTGCGKKWCSNEWCRNGRDNTGLESKPTNAQGTLPLVKPLLEKVLEPDSRKFFCVDETNQRRRNIAELLASEKVWELEWCIAACEAENGNLDKARQWLHDWAPKGKET